MKQWYDGYDLKGIQIYNPRSVVMSLLGHDFDSYWTKTETYEALKKYIQQENTGIVYVDMTRLGLVELTRKKNGKTLRELFADGRKEEE